VKIETFSLVASTVNPLVSMEKGTGGRGNFIRAQHTVGAGLGSLVEYKANGKKPSAGSWTAPGEHTDKILTYNSLQGGRCTTSWCHLSFSQDY